MSVIGSCDELEGDDANSLPTNKYELFCECLRRGVAIRHLSKELSKAIEERDAARSALMLAERLR